MALFVEDKDQETKDKRKKKKGYWYNGRPAKWASASFIESKFKYLKITIQEIL